MSKRSSEPQRVIAQEMIDRWFRVWDRGVHVVLQGYFEFGERSLSTCSVDHFNPRVIRLSGTLRCC